MDIEDYMKPPKYTIDVRPIGNRITIHLGFEIDTPDHYCEIADVLNNATEMDEVNVHLASVGGSVHGGTLLVNSFRYCRAPVYTFVRTPCYSMGAILALAGDMMYISSGCFLMFHQSSGGTEGQLHNIKSNSEAEIKSYKELLTNSCSPFLTSKEIKDILSGKEIYCFSSDKDFVTRLTRHYPGAVVKVELEDGE